MRSRAGKFLIFTCTMAVAGWGIPQDASAMALTNGDGVTLDQISFRGGSDSGVGQITVDRAAVIAATHIDSGFINISDGGGNWLVKNLPVFDTGRSDADVMTAHFNLPSLPNMLFSIDYSAAPTTYYNGIASSWTLGKVDNAVGGVDAPVYGYRAGPNLSSLVFNATNPAMSFVYQRGHTNVQTADKQCAPAAVANSLDWLRITQGLKVPDPNVLGLRDDVNPNDKSLVGKLEKDMNRGVRSRADGDGAWPLDGKLEYLRDTGLAGKLYIEHVGDGGDGAGGTLSGNKDYTAYGVTSHGKGALTWQWIFDELSNNEDVELEYAYASGGAHYVDVTGAGMIFGIPFITHISDQIQSDMDPTDTKGTGTVQFDFLINTPQGLFLTGENAYAVQAISESVPEPSTLALLAAAGLIFLWRRRPLQEGRMSA